MTGTLLKHTPSSRRFLPALCASALFLCLFGLYLYAHESDGGWGDGPDFVVCSYFLGVPHPTGYPLFAILGKAATFVPVGTIAFRVGLLSTCAGALGGAFLFFIFHKQFRVIVIPLIAAYSFCEYSIVFSQAVTVEAYALNFLFLTILAFIFLQNSNARVALGFFLVAIIGLGNHGTLIFAAVVLGLMPLIKLLKSRIGGSSLMVIAFIISLGFCSYASLPLFAARGAQFIWNNPQNLNNFQSLLSGTDFWSGMMRYDIFRESLKVYLLSSIFESFFLALLFCSITVILAEKKSALPSFLFFVCATAASIFAFSYPTAEKASFLLLPITAMFIGVLALPGMRKPNVSHHLSEAMSFLYLFALLSSPSEL